MVCILIGKPALMGQDCSNWICLIELMIIFASKHKYEQGEAYV